MKLFWTLFLISFVTQAAETSLTPREQENLNQRIRRFYQEPHNPELMNESFPKFSLRRQQFVTDRKSPLQLKGAQPTHPLLKSAQIKGTPQFQKYYCETVLKKHFPHMQCDSQQSGWAFIQSQDKAEELAYGWTNILHDLDQIPTKGHSDQPLWSDDYWRMRWGLTSYRYSEGKNFATYKEAVAAYSQPAEYLSLLNLPLEELSKKVVAWSPSEKYDVAMGDTQFTLTQEQKNEGLTNLGPEGNVEDWVGICHGWAAASIMATRPQKAVRFIGPRGVAVDFYPNDIKALFTLAWANGDYASNGAGMRCYDKQPKLLPNGRIISQDCWDTNPATFHLSLGNMLGRANKTFVMDKTFDYEVWNQPIHSYEFLYFNPLDPNKTSQNWKEVAVDYDDNFKKSDRFQNPLTRGRFTNRRAFRRFDDKLIKKIVGVRATVVYLVESTPEHTPQPQLDDYERESYVYDLELVDKNGRLEAEGGEWHNNIHPDFLWVPAANSLAYNEKVELVGLSVTPGKEPTAVMASGAQKASAYGYPLCGFLSSLLKESAGSGTYQCGWRYY